MYDSNIIRIMGFREDDCVYFACKNSSGTDYNARKYKFSEMINELNNQQELNYYISHATHSGAAGFKEDVFSEIVEMVIDIDYGIHHKQDCRLATLAEAQTEAAKLPTPTLMISSGGGIQMHYRLKERLNASDSKVVDRFKRTAQRIQSLVGADSCQAIGHVFRLPYTTNYKDGAEPRHVEIIACNPDLEYDFAWLESRVSRHAPLKLATRIARKKAQKRKKKKNGQDRSSEASKHVEKLLRKHPNITDRKLLAMLKQKPCFEHYIEGDLEPETRCLADIRRIRRKLTTDKRPEPANEVVDIEYTGKMSEQLSKARERFNQIVYDTKNPRLDISLSLIEKLFLDKSQAIINFPCAAGKTTAAMIIASAHANPKNRIWIVTEKISNVIYIAETLRNLGVNALEWHGRDDRKCKVSYQEFSKYKTKTICAKCENHCTAYRKYMSKNVWDDESADVLVTTHSHWSAAIAGEKIPSSVKMVFVDEAPSLMEYFPFTLDDIEDIKTVFEENKELLETLNHDVNYICD
ncbi:MAG: hypothetical protein WCV67_14840, partial [Victivallaceae bacterium]